MARVTKLYNFALTQENFHTILILSAMPFVYFDSDNRHGQRATEKNTVPGLLRRYAGLSYGATRLSFIGSFTISFFTGSPVNMTFPRAKSTVFQNR